MRDNAGPGSLWTSVARSGGARLIVLAVSALLGIVVTRVIFENFGRAAFAQYGLLVTLGSLVPFADLGMAAAVTNAVATSSDPRHDDRVGRTLLTAVRIMLASAGVLLIVVVLVSMSGGWPRLLGAGLMPGTGGRLAAGLCAALIAVSIPVGIGQRALVGLGRNHLSILVLGLQTPLVLLVLLVLVGTHSGGGAFVAVIPYVVTFVLAGCCCLLAARMLRPQVRTVLRRVPRIRAERGAAVFDTAWPMVVQMVALPIAMQTDRVVLSHVAGVRALAEYSLAAQLYAPVWAVVSSAGAALWPIFARARTAGRSAGSPLRVAVVFAAGGAAMCLVLSVAGPWLFSLASGGRVHPGLGLMIAFSALMTMQATKYPLGMYLTDPRGLRFQALTIAVFVPLNLGLSIVLAHRLGAVGPVIGSAVGVFVSQVLANAWYVRRRLAETQPAAAVPEPVGSAP